LHYAAENAKIQGLLGISEGFAMKPQEIKIVDLDYEFNNVVLGQEAVPLIFSIP
jgi:hypothetical protein